MLVASALTKMHSLQTRTRYDDNMICITRLTYWFYYMETINQLRVYYRNVNNFLTKCLSTESHYFTKRRQSAIKKRHPARCHHVPITDGH
jgi:hypothetical protein